MQRKVGLKDYQKEFIQLAIDKNVLKFGEFTLKSGRTSPYFFNAGLFNDGASLAKLGLYYARTLIDAGLDCDMLFGPAYKGIPIATATAAYLATNHNRNVPVAFNRKEAKTHGEGGTLIGAPLAGQVVIVDDVITAGTAIREVLSMIEATDAKSSGVVVALDRQEQGQGELSAIQELEKEFDLPVASIVNLEQVLAYIAEDSELARFTESVSAYRDRYGILS